MVHANAPLSDLGRLRLVRCVVESGWPVARAAERFQVSRATALGGHPPITRCTNCPIRTASAAAGEGVVEWHVERRW